MNRMVQRGGVPTFSHNGYAIDRPYCDGSEYSTWRHWPSPDAHILAVMIADGCSDSKAPLA